MRPNSVLLVLTLSLIVACAETEIPSHTGQDRQGYASSGVTAPGSKWTYPTDWNRPFRPEDRVLDPAEEYRHQELPLDSIGRLAPFMSEAELIELLGPPRFKDTRAISTDRSGEDWNARVYTWQFQDSRLTTMEMTRDLEVLLGQPDANRSHPERPDVLGPDLLVVDWQLF